MQWEETGKRLGFDYISVSKCRTYIGRSVPIGAEETMVCRRLAPRPGQVLLAAWFYSRLHGFDRFIDKSMSKQ